jgi:5'-deoxynucleotidase YfbR-like HD superfamily hydrolase/nucleoside phosphorylase
MERSLHPPTITLAKASKRVSIAILTFREDEEQAAHRHFPQSGLIVGGERRFSYYSVIETEDNSKLHVAVVRTQDTGPVVAANTVKDIVRDFAPAWIFLVGIAGGFPENEFSLGDIVLINRLQDLSITAAIEGGTVEYDVRGGAMHPDVLKLLQSKASLQSRLEGWTTRLHVQRPAERLPSNSKSKSYYGTPTSRAKVHHALWNNFKTGNSNARVPYVVCGPAISSGVLLKDTRLAEEWRKHERKAMCVEMELAGAYASLQNSQAGLTTRLLPIRAISDIVGYKRSATWTAYACDAAAAFARHLLGSGIISAEGIGGLNSKRHKARRPNQVATAETPTWKSSFPVYFETLESLPEKEFTRQANLFAEMLQFLCRQNGERQVRPEVWLRTMVEQIVAAPQGIPLAVRGAVGTGKTTLLALLAVCARRRLQDKSGMRIEYINLHSYDELTASQTRKDYEKRAEERLSSDVERLKELGRLRQVRLLVDGFDNYQRDRIPGYQARFKKLVKGLPGVCIIAIGEAHDEHQPHYRAVERGVPDEYKPLVDLERVPTETCDGLVASFCKVLSAQASSADLVDSAELCERCKSAGLKSVDLFELDVLRSAKVRPPMRDGRVEFTIALQNYLTRHLQADLDQRSHEVTDLVVACEDEMKKAARHVFVEDICKQPPTDHRYNVRCWGLFTAHPEVRSFLCAYHIIATLAAAGSQLRPKKNSTARINKDLAGYVFPETINRHAKALLNGARDTSLPTRVFAAISSVCEARLSARRQRATQETAPLIKQLDGLSKDSDLTYLCYLLGRFRTAERDKASTLLGRLKRWYIDQLQWADNAAIDEGDAVIRECLAKLRLLQCTILTSQICVSATDEERQPYINDFLSRLNHSGWRGQTCAFHLKYYGDRLFEYEVDKHLSFHADDLDPFPRTLKALSKWLKRSDGAERNSPLYAVQIGVLGALATARKIDTKALQKPGQEECLRGAYELLKHAKDSGSYSPASDSQLALSLRVLAAEGHIYPQAIVAKLYEAKFNTRRSGWIEHLSIDATVESVADHTWGAMLLAELLLPETLPPGPNSEDVQYSKAEVIRSLLVHDLPEAILGDRPITPSKSGYRDETARGEEKAWAQQLSRLGILAGYEPQLEMEERWDTVEDKVGPNGKIARAIDKLDTLVQMIIYSRKHARKDNKRWNAFFNNVREDFQKHAITHPLTRALVSQWLAWANYEWGQSGTNMQQDVLFQDVDKYYPGEKLDGE